MSRGRGSLALAQICLEAYGRKWPANARRPEDLYFNNEFLGSITAAAWVCLAANSNRSWITGEPSAQQANRRLAGDPARSGLPMTRNTKLRWFRHSSAHPRA